MSATLSGTQPMRVIVLVDLSAATSSAMPQIRTAVGSLIDALPGEHEIALVTTGRHHEDAPAVGGLAQKATVHLAQRFHQRRRTAVGSENSNDTDEH